MKKKTNPGVKQAKQETVIINMADCDNSDSAMNLV